MNKIELVDIRTLRLSPLNDAARAITKEKYDSLKYKIKRFGQLGALLIDGRDKMSILGGRHAYEAMRELGFEEVKVEYRTPKDDAEAIELIIVHNERFATWVEQELAELLHKHREAIDLSSYSVDLGKMTDAKKVLARYGQTDEDEFDGTVPEDPVSKKGEVYQLGRHRLMCGDSTDAIAVAKLMAGRKVSLLLTDPPYGVSYEGNPNGEAWEMIANDDLRGDALLQFLYKAFENIAEHAIPHMPAYVFYASSTHKEFQTALELAGYQMRQQIIWVKHMVIGNSDYHWSHEPILYCQLGKERPPFYGDRANTTLLKEAKYDDLERMSKEQLIEMIKAVRETSTIWLASQDARRGVKYDHPTQKPVSILTPAIKNSTAVEDIVVDLFGGSGSTMAAAHQLDRTAYLMEFSEGFCDVIRKRYAKLIGEEDRWQEITPLAKQ